MSARFEELDWCATPIGLISLRRRHDPVADAEVFEVKLGDEFLMSSLWTVAEIEVARAALAAVSGDGLQVVVGGLGLGYTAQAVLDDPRVCDLAVVEALAPVIDWHERGLVPVSVSSASDARCRLVLGDFFALVAAGGLDPEPGRRFHAIIVDIDHSPRHLLDPSHAGFYDLDGTRRLAALLYPGGVFALWSNDPPDPAYQAVLRQVFAEVSAEVVAFPNPLQGRDATNTVYVAKVRVG
jgi:spermidine synthase